MEKGTILLYMPFFLAESMKADTSSLAESLSPIEVMLTKELSTNLSIAQKQVRENKIGKNIYRLFQYKEKISPYEGQEFSFALERVVRTPKVSIMEFGNFSLNVFKGFLYELGDPQFGKGYLIKPSAAVSSDKIGVSGCVIYYLTDKK